jgi:hypothetical protein
LRLHLDCNRKRKTVTDRPLRAWQHDRNWISLYQNSYFHTPCAYKGHLRTLSQKEENVTKSKSVYHPELQCSVFGLSYDFVAKQGALQMAEGNACDMDGCIAVFRRIDPSVKAIQTVAGDASDTSYRLVGKEWKASLPPRNQTPSPE